MKIIITEPAPGEEDTVTINVKCMSDNIMRAINLLKNDGNMTVYIDDNAFMLPIADVFYSESVELKTFIYAEKAVYRSRLKLYEVEELLSGSDFLRISKQVIVNVQKIKSVKPAGNGRFQAELVNGERVIISRQYVHALKERFRL
ncbi:MAG: LytTR family transcriptional regulator [Oscillospiraceae bacterium]|nr:LytTR family transcriptional regulator [Oscillospiraceae bacterium]